MSKKLLGAIVNRLSVAVDKRKECERIVQELRNLHYAGLLSNLVNYTRFVAKASMRGL